MKKTALITILALLGIALSTAALAAEMPAAEIEVPVELPENQAPAADDATAETLEAEPGIEALPFADPFSQGKAMPASCGTIYCDPQHSPDPCPNLCNNACGLNGWCKADCTCECTDMW